MARFICVLLLLFVLINWKETDSSDVTVSPVWRSALTSLRGSVLTPYHYSPLEDDHLPTHHQSQLLGQDNNQDQCILYKILMSQQLYFEYIHYKIDLPDLKEFTLCIWNKFTNHSNDHPLFSYAVGDQPRSILSWIANTERSSYYMLNVDGHNLYRLNYPLRLNRWYHSCQSWNGHTGEWQIWVNDERVGRGFHNRLVGHVIKGGGVAISGQEQRQIGGGFFDDKKTYPGAGGMMGEMTMLQLYGVALTAGKAHRDHKHHHAHHFEHNHNNNVPVSTTTPETTVTSLPLPMNPYLTGGQLNHQVKINPGAHIQIVRNGVTLRHPNLPASSAVPQPLPPAILPTQRTVDTNINLLQANLRFDLDKNLEGTDEIRDTSFLSTQSIKNPSINDYSFIDRRYRNVITSNIDNISKKNINLQRSIDETGEIQIIDNIEIKKISKRENLHHIKPKHHEYKKEFENVEVEDESKSRRSTNNTTTIPSSDKKKQKRELVYTEGFAIDNSYISEVPQQFRTNTNFYKGLTNFGPISVVNQRPKKKEDEREPAEEEVRRVMNICDGCVDEPFEKAIVISWRTVPKKLYSGAFHVPAIQVCKAF